METGGIGFSAGAAAHAWRSSPSPSLLSASPRGEEGGIWGWRERMWATTHAMVVWVWCVPNEKSGSLIRLLEGDQKTGFVVS